MDTSIRRRAEPTSDSTRRTLSIPARAADMVFITGAVNAVPDLCNRRFIVVGTGATITSLRKAIIDCAAQATTAEPVDTERRLLSFMARMSASMEGLGERELDAVLWDLTKTRSATTTEG